MQDHPAAVLGVDEQERLDRLAIGRAADLAEQARRSPSMPRALRASSPDPPATVSGLRHDLLALDHVLQDEHDLVGRGAVQIGAAAEFGDLFSRLGRLRGHRREAGRDDDAFGLLGAALQRLDARR